MRTLEPVAHRAPETPFEPGAAPMLQWVRIEDLVVDDSYQRTIQGAGRRNVQAIAGDFRWSKFAPVIASPVAGGKFAVIDGQHRATAAALRGVEQVPALIVIADRAEQAAAFKAVNGQTTRMHALEIHRAAVAAADAEAVAIDQACSAANVSICASPKAPARMKPGETLAIGAIRLQLRRSPQVLVTGLSCVTRTSNNKPGALSASAIVALCDLVTHDHALWGNSLEALYGAFGRINLSREEIKAKTSPRDQGVAVWSVLRNRLRARVAEQRIVPRPVERAA